jgi:RHS repeat-associated protein
MLQPGRSGYSISGGWATSSTGESGTPSHLQISSRSGNGPTLYQATELIEFVGEFQSGAGDEFTAEIGDGSAGSGGNGSGSGIAGSGYRYGFNGKEKLDEIFGDGNAYDFGERGYDPRTGRMWSVDPLTDQMPAWSPYSYAFNSPIRFVDKDGEIPILPLLLKAGAAGAADLMAQAATNYYFNPETSSNVEKSFGAVSWWQVSRSALEGLIPWKTPGGRIGRAAGTAIGDVMINAFDQGTNYTKEKAVQDFAVGFIGDLAGGGMGELVTKYGAQNVAKGLLKIGFDYPFIAKAMGGGVRNISKSVDGVTSTRMVEGWAKGKVAIIGRDMEGRVDVFKKGLEKEGINAETFHWDKNLTPDENYKRNTAWVKKIKQEGYTVYDTGTGPIPRSPDKGEGYGMETKQIFGDKK